MQLVLNFLLHDTALALMFAGYSLKEVMLDNQSNLWIIPVYMYHSQNNGTRQSAASFFSLDKEIGGLARTTINRPAAINWAVYTRMARKPQKPCSTFH